MIGDRSAECRAAHDKGLIEFCFDSFEQAKGGAAGNLQFLADFFNAGSIGLFHEVENLENMKKTLCDKSCILGH